MTITWWWVVVVVGGGGIETVPHKVNEVDASRKLKACFSGNCFPLISYCVFSGPATKYWLSLQKSGLKVN